MRSQHPAPPKPFRPDRARARGLKRARRLAPMPPVAATDMPDWVDDLDFAVLFMRYRQDAGMQVIFRVDLYKTLWAELELLRQLGHGGRAGGTVVSTSFQLVASFAKLHPAWEMNGDENQRRDCYWPRVRRRLRHLQAMGLLTYRIDTDDELYERRLLLELLPRPEITETERKHAADVLGVRWTKYGASLNTGTRTGITDVYIAAGRLAPAERKKRGILHSKAVHNTRKQAARTAHQEGSTHESAHPFGGPQQTEDHYSTPTTNAHTRVTGIRPPQFSTALDPLSTAKNSSQEEERGDPNLETARQTVRKAVQASLQAAQRAQSGPGGTQSFANWSNDGTYDLEAYNRQLLGWVTSGRQGAPPHPGRELIIPGQSTDPRWHKALALHRLILAELTASETPPELGPYDRPNGQLDLDAYRGAIARYSHSRDLTATVPHPGHRQRSRQHDREWHEAIERYNEIPAVIAASAQALAENLQAQEAASRLSASGMLSITDERTLRAVWVLHRWGAQDLAARGLYGAGCALDDADRASLRQIEATYLQFVDWRPRGWPTSAAAALAHIATARRRGELSPIHEDYPVGRLRLLKDGLRRLKQEAKRMRSRAKSDDSDRSARQSERQLQEDRQRQVAKHSWFTRQRDPLADVDGYDLRELRTAAERREYLHDLDQARARAASSLPNLEDPDVALRWQLNHLPAELLLDPEGLPVFDPYGRLRLHPEHLPEDDSPSERRRVAAIRAQLRPVYLRLGLPLPAEHDGALYQTLKTAGQLPPPADQPRTAEPPHPGPDALSDRSVLYRQALHERLHPRS